MTSYTPYNDSEYQEYVARHEGGFWGFWIKYWKISFLVIIMILIGGITSLQLLPKESSPKVKLNMTSLYIEYPGASPADVDEQINEKVTKAVDGVAGVKKITTSASQGSADVTIDLDTGIDTDKAIDDINSALGSVSLPVGVTMPTAEIISASDGNDILFQLVLAAPIEQYTLLELYEHAEVIKDSLLDVDGVKNVYLGRQGKNDLSYEITISVDHTILEGYGLSLDDIANTIRAYDTKRPIGNVVNGTLTYDYKINSTVDTLEHVRNLPIGDKGITINDVATITRNFPDATAIRYGAYNKTGYHALSLNITKKDKYNIFTASKETKAKVEQLLALPQNSNIEAHYANDTAETIGKDYNVLARNGVTTLISVFFILLFFIGLKESVIAVVVLPLAFLVTFISLHLAGYSLNFLTNFSLILSLGIAIDAFLVVIEGTTEKIRVGYNPKTAVLLSIKDYKLPLISGTATTAVAFIPLMLLPGILGAFLKYIPITIFITLVAALFIALTLCGALLYKISRKRSTYIEPDHLNEVGDEEDIRALLYERQGKTKTDHTHKARNRREALNIARERLHGRFGEGYKSLLRRYLKRGILRRSSVLIPIILLVLSFVFLSPQIGFSLFPSGDNPRSTLTISTRPNSTIETITPYIAPLEAYLSSIPEIKLYEIRLSSNTISTTIELRPKDYRTKNKMKLAADVGKEINTALDPLRSQGLDIDYSIQSNGPPAGSAVAAQITASSSSDLPKLIQASHDIEKYMTNLTIEKDGKQLPALTNVRSSFGETVGEFSIQYKQDIIQRMGLSPSQISSYIGTVVNGVTTNTLPLNGKDREVKIVANAFSGDVSPRDILDLSIKTPLGGTVSVADLITIGPSTSIPHIARTDGNITIEISATNTPDFQPSDVQRIVDAYVGLDDDSSLPSYTFPEGISTLPAGEQAENDELLTATKISFAITMITIFLILVLQFNSYTQPIIILYSVILALLGVNLGLFLTKNPYSMPFGIGFVALTGIVVNDAIIFIDRINGNREKGLPPLDAILEAGKSRLQPIILTTVTTLSGVLPLAFYDEFWAGLAYTVVFGLFAGSLMTLFVIPSLYYIFFVRKKRRKRKKQQNIYEVGKSDLDTCDPKGSTIHAQV